MPASPLSSKPLQAWVYKNPARGVLFNECRLHAPVDEMTESSTDPPVLSLETADRVQRALLWLLAARILLALVVVCLVLFLFRWSGAVRRDVMPTPEGQQVPDDWKVVIPEYQGGGRGSKLVAVKPWRFGIMGDHPVIVTLCISAAVIGAGAFVGGTLYAARLKNSNQPDLPPSS
jgi:hypothetical protein